MINMSFKVGDIIWVYDEFMWGVIPCTVDKPYHCICGEKYGCTFEMHFTEDDIVKYFGEEHELRERELNKKIRDAKFSNEQFEVLKETIAYTKEKHSKPIDKNKCEDCKYYINNKCTHPYSTCCKHCELWTPKWFE